jgi:protein ImuA
MCAAANPFAANQNLSAPELESEPLKSGDSGVKSLFLKGLKDEVARLEKAAAAHSGLTRWGRMRDRVVTLGCPDLDAHLPWGGLPRGALHELAGEGRDREQGAAAAGFAALWLAKLQAAGPVLWISRGNSRAAIDLYAHGLRQLRLDPGRLILIAARRDEEALWSLEEGLKARSLGAVIGEVGRLDLTASRRLQLAAEASGVTAFVLRRWRLMAAAEREAAQPIAALTRWRIATTPGQGELHWQVRLARCRGGRPGAWRIEQQQMEQADGSYRLHAAPLSGDLAPALVGGSLAAASRKAG